jgi:alpha-D-xyloside xylohydrolase
VPLAPPLQHSGELPGGPLNVHVYSGADGTFTLFEDDGETNAYADVAAPIVSTLVLGWEQGTGCLSWAQGGAVPNAAASHAFTALGGTVFSADGTQKVLPVTLIGSTPGKVCTG